MSSSGRRRRGILSGMRRPGRTGPLPALPHPLALLALSLAAALALATCNINDPFADYYDTTRNFIAASGLDQQDLTTAGYESNAAWTWAWRGDSNDAAGGYAYMTLADTGNTAGAGAPAGLDAAAKVYRLTLANLVADGDFNNASTPPATWYTLSAGPFVRLETSASMVHGNGKSLYVQTGDKKGVRYNLVDSLLDYNASAKHSYYWYMLTKDASIYYYQVVTGSTVLDSNSTITDNVIQVPASASVTDSRQPLTGIGTFGGVGNPQDILFGYTTFFNLIVDDLRFVRSDITPCLRLRLRSPDTTPVLVNGYYELTLWIRKPADLAFVTEDAAANPYAAGTVTLKMTDLLGGKGGTYQTYPVGSDWKQAVLRQNAGGNFDRINGASQSAAAVELAIYPCDSASPQPGTVEIAQPELHIYVNNYKR